MSNKRGRISGVARRVSMFTMAAPIALAVGATSAAAQSTSVVGVCSGVSLPPSVVTDIMRPVITGIADPLENRVNDILGVIDIIPIVGRVLPRLNLNATGLLNNAAAGQPITLRVLDTNGTIVGPADPCNAQADSFSLRTPAGIAVGGNRITGLGAAGQQATAGEVNSIAFGNAANTTAGSAGAIAIGANASVTGTSTGSIALGTGAAVTAANSVALGANASAARGPLAGYTAVGLGVAQTSTGEVSVGAAGAARQITNVAAGSAPTDAVNVAQLSGVAAQVGAIAGTTVLYNDATRTGIALAGVGGTTITNLRPGTLAAGSTDAVNGGQLFATDQNVAANTTNITNLTAGIQNGGVGTVQYSNTGSVTVPNGGIPTNEVTLVGAAAAPVGLHNVRDGTVVAGSTDAVNGGQLFALGTSTASAMGGGTFYDAATNALITQLTVGGMQHTTIQSALDALIPTAVLTTELRYLRVQSTRAGATVSGTDSVAIGPDASATASNSVALGAGALATRGAAAGYLAFGLASPQTSTGEVSVGAAGGERQITNVAAGSAGTDAVNVAQLQGVANQVTALGSTAVQYDAADRGRVTLGGANGTVITNVAAGVVASGSTDAVNGGQLAATEARVAGNTTAISNLSTSIANGSAGPVQYANAGSTTPNGGTRTNNLTLVGATSNPVTLSNVAGGRIAVGSTDAVNGGQIAALAFTAVNAVSYDADAAGNRTNTVTLSGGNAQAPVTLRNVADGQVTATSTEAVNGRQLNTVGQAAAAAQATATAAQSLAATANATAGSALALGQNSIQYDTATRTDVTLGGAGSATPIALHNVASGVRSTDAVNVMQLNNSVSNAVSQSNAYTDQRLLAINYDLATVKRDANSGSASALAAAALPQAYEAGRGMIALAAGTYGGQSAFAFGFSKAFNDGHTVVKLGATRDTRGRSGANAGIGYQF